MEYFYLDTDTEAHNIVGTDYIMQPQLDYHIIMRTLFMTKKLILSVKIEKGQEAD